MTSTMNGGPLAVLAPNHPPVVVSFAHATKSVSWVVSVNAAQRNAVTAGSYTVTVSGAMTLNGQVFQLNASNVCSYSDQSCVTSFFP
jgi:hypothetical protein